MISRLLIVGGGLLVLCALLGWLHQARPTVIAPTPSIVVADVKKAPVKAAQVPIKTNFGNYKQNLIMAYNVATELGVPPLLLQGIMLQESRAGRHHTLSNNGAYGLMQIKVNTARSVLQRHPTLTLRYFGTRKVSRVSNYEIKKLLLTNPEANVRIGCHNLIIYNAILGLGWDAAVAAYNMGIGNALKRVDTLSTNPYTLTVNSYADELLYDFNNKHIQQ